MNIKFGVFWKQNLGTIYKDNSITTLGKEADVDLNLSEVSSIHANFKVDGKNYTSIVYIVDIEKGLIRIPFTREVLSIGMHELELVAVMKNGDVIPSQTFTYNIVESLDNLEDITEETNYPILIQLLQDVNSKIAEIDDAIARIPSPEELKGEKGDKGDKGEQGIQGERGLQGIQGIRGEKGDKGDRGLQGIQGVKGEKGDKGERGERGLQGIQGNQGARGIQGEKGDKGETGVGLGFEWSGTKLGVKKDTDISYKYVELKGAKGEQGAKGEKGDTPSIAHLEKQVSDKSKELDTKFNTLTAKQQQDSEVVTARDGEVSLHARLERDLEKGKIHFVDVEGEYISTESEEGYLENIEIHGNTWQDSENLADIRSVGDKVEGQELYEIDIVSYGKNLLNPSLLEGEYLTDYRIGSNGVLYKNNGYKALESYKEIPKQWFNRDLIFGFIGCIAFYSNKSDSGLISRFFQNSTISVPQNAKYFRVDFQIETPNLQIEEGTVATSYEPYQEDKLTILSPTPLERVGDVADRIACKDGVLGVEKNISSYTIEDVSNIYVDDKLSNVYRIHIDTNNNFGCMNRGMITNIVPYNGGISWAKDEEGSYSDDNEKYGYRFWVHINKSKITTTLEDYVRQHLPINIIYKNLNPIFIPLPHDQQIKLRTFANKTNISFLTEIEGTIKAQVPKSLGATVNTHTTQIDNLNKELDRVKKLEESTVSTITSDKGFTTIAETSGGYFEDVKIEGKTLVNLFSNPSIIGTAYTYDNITKILTVPEADGRAWVSMPSLANLVVGKEYTFVLNALDTDLRCAYRCDPAIQMATPYLTMGINAFKFKATTDKFLLKIYSSLGDSSRRVSNIMLLEGDHTDKDITFFEGLKSVGQDNDEISVSSVDSNGNLANNVKYTGGYYQSNNGFVAHSNWVQSDYIRVYDTNTTYTFDIAPFMGNNTVVMCDSNKKPLKVAPRVGNTFNITDINCKYVVLLGRKNPETAFTTEELQSINTMLFKGDYIKPNIPHQSNKKQILYYNPTTQTWEKPILREWDSIEKHSDGKYYYHKRSGEVVLNGSENWAYTWATSETSSAFYVNVLDLKCKAQNPNLLCDKLVNQSWGDISNGIIDEGIITGVSGDIGYLGIRIPNSKTNILGADTNSVRVQKIKTWLQANPVTVVYQLAQEEVYECTNLDLITYQNETNLIVSSGAIQPRITLKVLSNVSNVVKLLQEKVSVLENKFIEGLKQVLAGDMMSLAHLLYPEDFENNHEIQTLEL